MEAAIAAAEEQLGIQRDELDIQILSHGSRGVFGLGGEPARVRARRLTEEAEPPAAAPAPEPPRRTETRAAAEARPSSAATVEAPARTTAAKAQAAPTEVSVLDLSEVSQAAREVLTEMLSRMGFDIEVSVRTNDPVVLDVTGEDLGVLIGRRGESLAALQFMLNVILSKRFHKWPRAVVDVQGYRARREQSLHSLGVRVAERVRRNRRPFTLEAMPANDRRIIHLALRDRSDVETYSIGEGIARRVVIAPRR